MRRIYGFFIAISAVITFAALAAVRNINQTVTTSDWVNHTHATIYAVDRVVNSAVTGDSAARSFVWTTDPRDLVQARGEFNEMSDHLESAKALTRSEGLVYQQILRLDTLAEQHAAAAIALATRRQGAGTATPEMRLKADPGSATLREIRHLAGEIRADQFELLNQRDKSAYLQAQTTRWVVGTSVVLDLLLFAMVAWLIRIDLKTRQKLAETLRTSNETLETRVHERTRDLAETNARLLTENLERKWATQSLEHQLRYNQTIVNAASDLVLVVTKVLTVTRINPAVGTRIGWGESDILGRPLADVLRGDASQPTDAIIGQIGQALQSGRELHHQAARVVNHAGVELPVIFTLLPLRDNDKVVGGVLLLQLTSTAGRVPNGGNS